jgi:hypothetical protein
MSFERSLPEDAAFERRLLDSARADARPPDGEAAWARFAGGLGAVSLDLGGAPGRIPARVAGVGGRTAFAVKWMLVGAIAGSGLTVALLMGRHPSSAGPAVAERAVPTAATMAPVPPTEERPAIDREPPLAAKHHLAHAGSPAPRAAAPSTLAQEVSRIDTARVAIVSGDYDEATRLIARYHDDFPDGELAPDADVVALEAAAAKHDRAEVARRARDFFARYPRDPHTARVAWLADHPQPDRR